MYMHVAIKGFTLLHIAAILPEEAFIIYRSITTHTFCEGGRIKEMLLVKFND